MTLIALTVTNNSTNVISLGAGLTVPPRKTSTFEISFIQLAQQLMPNLQKLSSAKLISFSFVDPYAQASAQAFVDTSVELAQVNDFGYNNGTLAYIESTKEFYFIDREATSGVATHSGQGFWTVLSSGGGGSAFTPADRIKLDGIAVSATNTPLTSSAPENVNNIAAAVGSSNFAARSDHKHDVDTDTVTDVGLSNAEGTSNSLARADHVHAHGNQTAGSLHAAAIPSGASGFLTGADKAKLDGVVAGATNTPLSNNTPVVTTKAAGLAGISSEASRSDHRHDAQTDVGAAWVIDTVGLEGTSSSFSRADHVHAVTAPAVPTNVTKLAALAGTSQVPARADHKHDISTSNASASAVGDVASEGTSTSLSRADHKHAVTAGSPVDIGTANSAGAAVTHTRSDHVHNLPFSTVQTVLSGATGAVSLNSQDLNDVGDINGVHYYPSSATDPVAPVPADGDRYWNTAIQEFMLFDALRSKFLSAAIITIGSGAAGNTAAGSFYKGADGLAYTTDIGHTVPKGTLVGLSLSHTNATSPSVEVLVNGVVIATMAAPGAGSTIDLSLNADFNQGLLQFRNKLAGGATAANVQITAFLKRRV